MKSDINILTVLLSLASGIITAIVGYLLNSTKTKAEIGKIRAETDKIIAETKTLSTKIDTGFAGKNFEHIYYDSANSTQFDFKVSKQKLWDENLRQEVGEKAEGDFKIINNVLNIERTDNNGRFGLLLTSYTKDGETLDYIKSDPTLGQQRKILIACEVKSLKNKKHTLDFVVRDTNNSWFTEDKEFKIQASEWTKIEAYFRVTPDKDFRFKLYDRDVENPPNSIQIRNLKVIEKF